MDNRSGGPSFRSGNQSTAKAACDSAGQAALSCPDGQEQIAPVIVAIGRQSLAHGARQLTANGLESAPGSARYRFCYILVRGAALSTARPMRRSGVLLCRCFLFVARHQPFGPPRHGSSCEILQPGLEGSSVVALPAGLVFCSWQRCVQVGGS